jgi:hypothetical protein
LRQACQYSSAKICEYGDVARAEYHEQVSHLLFGQAFLREGGGEQKFHRINVEQHAEQ